jgi:hypothetical protein
VCVCVCSSGFSNSRISSADDRAQCVRSASAFVYISGVSGNSPPQLLEDIHNLAVNEDTPVGNVLFTVNATDPEGSPVHYGILDTDRLGVDQDTGEVRVIQPLDREVSSSDFILCIFRTSGKQTKTKFITNKLHILSK